MEHDENNNKEKYAKFIYLKLKKFEKDLKECNDKNQRLAYNLENLKEFLWEYEKNSFKPKNKLMSDKEMRKKIKQNLQKFNRIIEEQKSRKSKRPQRSKTLSRRKTIDKSKKQISRIMTLGGTRKKNNMNAMYNMGSCSSDNEAMSNFARVPLSGGRRRRRRSRHRSPKRTQKKRRKRVKSRRRRTVRRRRRRR